VRWSVLGETGADVSRLREEHLPALARIATGAKERGERLDAVVVMTGLNDIKECFLFAQPSRHAGSFRDGLGELLLSIHSLAGAERSALLLPNTPLQVCPRFSEHWPLSLAVRAVTWLWEKKKCEAVMREARRRVLLGEDDVINQSVRFVEAPAELVEGRLFSADGMHPNDAGYGVWAELVAQQLLTMFRDPRL
jgi:lysophospholipase L1-like esterase